MISSFLHFILFHFNFILFWFMILASAASTESCESVLHGHGICGSIQCMYHSNSEWFAIHIVRYRRRQTYIFNVPYTFVFFQQQNVLCETTARAGARRAGCTMYDIRLYELQISEDFFLASCVQVQITYTSYTKNLLRYDAMSLHHFYQIISFAFIFLDARRFSSILLNVVYTIFRFFFFFFCSVPDLMLHSK